MPPNLSELGTAELEVLRTLWDDSPATVRDVLNRLKDRGRDLAYTTVLTFLTRLEQKGFVESDRSKMAYRYRPTVSREKVTRSRLRAVLDELYDGAAAPLVLQLVRDEQFTSDELSALHALVERLDRGAAGDSEVESGARMQHSSNRTRKPRRGKGS